MLSTYNRTLQLYVLPPCWDEGRTMRISEGNPVGSSRFSPEPMTASTGSSDDESPTIPETSLPLTTFSVEDCVYRGEGNANVVIALPQERKVIRFRKSVPDDVSPDGGKQRVEREVKFVRFVASCFLGPYTQIPEILRYDMKDIVRLSEAIRPLRPDKRCHKEISETYATKFPDYTFLQTKVDPKLFRSKQTFCVEIKPKQGYLRDDWKFQKCPYCLTQYHKLKKKVIAARSTYCPFDLFSGVEERMKSALEGLLKSPQNNLKIFKDGIIVYDQESSLNNLEGVLKECFQNSTADTNKEYINKLCNLLCTALLHSFRSEELRLNSTVYELYSSYEQDLKSTLHINSDIVAKAKKLLYFTGEACNTKGVTLPTDSVLERILCMQRLPFVSSEFVYNTYVKFCSLITNDILYFNLLNVHKPDEHWIYFYNQKNTVTENLETLKIRAKNASVSNESKFDDDNNGNKLIQFRDKKPDENVRLVSKSSLPPIYCKKNNLIYNKFSVIYNEENKHCNNEKETDLINTESILCLQNYLLFSCARDCSILIAFRELNPDSVSFVSDGNVLQLSDGLSFVCNIGISDLDPKNLHCIEKHCQRDTNVLNSVISVLEEELTIKNQLSSETQSLQ
nr:uncharacterized protein LOC117608095 isoform X2 [Osmia lignaria]